MKGSSLGETHSIGPPIRLDANASAADIKKQVLAAVADHLKKVQGRGNRDAKDKSTVTSFEVNRASPSKSTDSTRRKSDSNGNSDADDSDDELDDDRLMAYKRMTGGEGAEGVLMTTHAVVLRPLISHPYNVRCVSQG